MSSSSSRREFLKAAAVGSVGTAFSVPAARAVTNSLTLMHENSFIKVYDEYMNKTLIPAYAKETGVKVKYDLVSVGGLQTRVTTAAETKSGPDLTGMAFNWPFLYDEKLLDVTDIADVVGRAAGGWYPGGAEACFVGGKFKAVPFGNIGQLMNWRTDWFGEVGFKTFPDTWEGLLEAGTKLKKAGHPFGFELGHGFGDNHGWLYPLLWSFGAHEVEKDGKTIVIDSAETARAVDFCRKFYQDTMFEDVLGWTDPSNNKAWLAQQISCTNNAQSILWLAKREFPDIGKVTDHALNPKGPTGERFHILNPWSHGIFSHTPDPTAAKAFLRWLMQPKQVGAWYASAEMYYAPFLKGFEDAPAWKEEPRYIPFRDSMPSSHLPGWPAPLSRAQSETIAKYVVIDMFAKACAGATTKDVIAAAQAQLKQIYQQA